MSPTAESGRLPRITVATPSYNQARFLEAAMSSVLDQGYPNLEYIVIDGGSTDGSVEIIRRHADRLHYWVSEKDGGQYDGLNKAFARSAGEVMGWLNSDDLLLPWTLEVVGELFLKFPEVEWVTTLFPLCVDERGCAVSCRPVEGYTRHGFLHGENLPGGRSHARGYLQQEGTFWRRSLWQRCGGALDTSLRWAGDFELWARFFASGAVPYGVPAPLGGFRYQPDQKTVHHLAEYVEEARQVLRRHGEGSFGRWDSFWLRKLVKLQSHLRKVYHRRLASQEKVRVFYRERGQWEIQTWP
jgi:glycosyltransferase involved in cell wall biosynthesis